MSEAKVVLLIDTNHSVGREILRGITKYSQAYGPWTFFRELPNYRHPGSLRKLLSRLAQWKPDALILIKNVPIEEIVMSGIPYIITVGRKGELPNWYTIMDDDDLIGKMAAEHLLERGFRHFGFCGLDDMYWSHKRQAAFRQRIAAEALDTFIYKQPKSLIKRSWENEQILIAQWLRSLPKPVGIMACNDNRGREVIETCELFGLHIPEEIAVVGVDNDELDCELANPPLSSVYLNSQKVGFEAAKLIDKLISGEKVEEHSMVVVEPTHVVVRQSSDVIAIEDTDIASAMQFIRKNAKKPIQVGDVVQATNLSRRGLQRKFLQITGRPIHQEIVRARIEQVTRMLLDTNLTVSQIAHSLGYPGIGELIRGFNKQFGMPPLAYRKKHGLVPD